MRQCHNCRYMDKSLKSRKYDGDCRKLNMYVNNEDYCWAEARTPHEQQLLRNKKKLKRV